MSLFVWPLAATLGAIVGVVTHEALHAIAATALGELEQVGWQGGLAGGPFVDYRVGSRWRSEVVRKAPLVAGTAGAIALVLAYDGVSIEWVAAAGAIAGLLWTSPEDLFIDHARRS